MFALYSEEEFKVNHIIDDYQNNYQEIVKDINSELFVKYRNGSIITKIPEPVPLNDKWINYFGIGKVNGYPYKFNKGYLKIR